MQSPRILIVRLSAIGDVIQSMPIACALREQFPQAFLAWAVEERAGQLLQGHEALDRAHHLAPRVAEIARRRVAAPPPAARVCGSTWPSRPRA